MYNSVIKWLVPKAAKLFIHYYLVHCRCYSGSRSRRPPFSGYWRPPPFSGCWWPPPFLCSEPASYCWPWRKGWERAWIWRGTGRGRRWRTGSWRPPQRCTGWPPQILMYMLIRTKQGRSAHSSSINMYSIKLREFRIYSINLQNNWGEIGYWETTAHRTWNKVNASM